MTKIIVNEMPKTDKDCPFAICHDDNFFPAICELKRDKSNQWSMRFGCNQRHNCKVSEGHKCDMLMSINGGE